MFYTRKELSRRSNLSFFQGFFDWILVISTFDDVIRGEDHWDRDYIYNSEIPLQVPGTDHALVRVRSCKNGP